MYSTRMSTSSWRLRQRKTHLYLQPDCECEAKRVGQHDSLTGFQPFSGGSVLNDVEAVEGCTSRQEFDALATDSVRASSILKNNEFRIPTGLIKLPLFIGFKRGFAGVGRLRIVLFVCSANPILFVLTIRSGQSTQCNLLEKQLHSSCVPHEVVDAIF